MQGIVPFSRPGHYSRKANLRFSPEESAEHRRWFLLLLDAINGLLNLIPVILFPSSGNFLDCYRCLFFALFLFKGNAFLKLFQLPVKFCFFEHTSKECFFLQSWLPKFNRLCHPHRFKFACFFLY